MTSSSPDIESLRKAYNVAVANGNISKARSLDRRIAALERERKPSSVPEIDRLIAAARARHAGVKGSWGWGADDPVETRCDTDAEPWPCPDRSLIEALVPVYEAAKAVNGAWDNAAAALDALHALRAALGEPNA